MLLDCSSMNCKRLCSKRGVHYLLETVRSRQYTKNTMDPRFQAPFESSLQRQTLPHVFNAAPPSMNSSSTPSYPSSHTAHIEGTQITSSVSDIQVVAHALQSVSIVNDSAPPQNNRWPPKQSRKVTPKIRTESPGTSSPSARGERDAKVQPSKASGGIPNPTNTYLALSNTVPLPLQEPQHLLVVIDLNGTLLFRPSRKSPTKFTARPNTYRFLKYCIDTFTVAIWSSAMPENVNNMCNAILTPDLRKKVVAIWGRDKFGLSQADYGMRVQCYKRLTKLWADNKVARSHPLWDMGLRWDQTNTVLIDDSLEKGRSEPFNLVEIPEFFGDEKETGEFLPQVHDFLNHLSMHSNVSACLRARPFKAQLAPLPPTEISDPRNCESADNHGLRT
jgi:NLI interacting factor-like phosphatase